MPSSPLDYRRHYSGAILFDGGSGAGWTQISDTLQCAHCARHWVPQPGSGIRRGWCFKCAAPVCGWPACFVCEPQEAWLERMEAIGRMEANIAAIRGA